MEKFDKVIEFLKSHKDINFTGGIFNSKNIVGDPMDNIYQEDGIWIDYCYIYCYIEIFGLSNKEFKYLCNRILDEC